LIGCGGCDDLRPIVFFVNYDDIIVLVPVLAVCLSLRDSSGLAGHGMGAARIANPISLPCDTGMRH